MRDVQFNKYRDMMPMLFECNLSGRVLDVGIGPGLFEDFLKEKAINLKVIGIDPDDRMASKARQKGYSVVIGSGESLPFEDESFSLVVCLDTIHTIKDQAKAVSEMFRVLKKGEKLLISHHCNVFTKQEVRAKLDALLVGRQVLDRRVVGIADQELSMAFLVGK